MRAATYRRSQARCPGALRSRRMRARDDRTFVEIENVTHAYGGEGGVIAVDKLTLSIAEGEFAAVVGPSGCGKSTLMKLVTGLQFPQAGAIAVGGAKVTGPLKIAGMAFQAPSLLPWRSTLENILLPLEIVQPHRKRLRSERARLHRQGRGAVGAGRPRRPRRQVSLGAVGGHAAARLALPRADPRAAAAHAGRAVRRARQLHTRGAVVRDARPACRPARHHHPGDARSARGGLPGRSRLLHERTTGPHHRRAARDVSPAPQPGGHLHRRVHRSCPRSALADRQLRGRPDAHRQPAQRDRGGALRLYHRLLRAVGGGLPAVQGAGLLPAGAQRHRPGHGRVLVAAAVPLLPHAVDDAWPALASPWCSAFFWG